MSFLMLGMNDSVLNGLSTLITLIPDIFIVVRIDPIHPIITTKKSS